MCWGEVMSSLESEKCHQVSAILKELDLDLWMVWVRETSQMPDPVLDLILGGDLVWQSALLFTKDGDSTAIIGSLDADSVRSKALFKRVVTYDTGIKDVLLKELERLSPKEIGMNFSRNDVAADGLTVGMYRILEDYLAGSPYSKRIVSAETLVSKLRGRKTETEVSRLRRAVEITEDIFKTLQPELRTGVSELDIYARVHEMMRQLGVSDAWNPDHNPAVDAGPNKQFGHSGPTDNKTKDGHLLHFDFGVKYQGYCADLQRMYYFGSPSKIPDEINHAFAAVRDSIQSAADFIRPGVTGNEVDAVARDFVKQAGYEEFKHALGHQLGRHAHDGGTLLGPMWEKYRDSPMGIVEAGNIFTLELYVTTENYGQVSLEEDILVTRTGCEFLSNPQKELICLK
jgi:Xaa-Pro aminopeptidase